MLSIYLICLSSITVEPLKAKDGYNTASLLNKNPEVNKGSFLHVISSSLLQAISKGLNDLNAHTPFHLLENNLDLSGAQSANEVITFRTVLNIPGSITRAMFTHNIYRSLLRKHTLALSHPLTPHQMRPGRYSDPVLPTLPL